ncbi:hypothetical protein KCU81_g407, partial [Aureobasidium melanogenum]
MTVETSVEEGFHPRIWKLYSSQPKRRQIAVPLPKLSDNGTKRISDDSLGVVWNMILVQQRYREVAASEDTSQSKSSTAISCNK